MKRSILLACLLFPALAGAQTQGRVASESRDAATGYIFTENFTVGRYARDCFGILARTDTPKDFVALWQKRNAAYYSAAVTYINRRLIEAEGLGGVEARNNVASALNAAIARDGAGAVSDAFKKGERQEVCKKMIGLIESGAFDIGPTSPMYAELRALVDYVAGNSPR